MTKTFTTITLGMMAIITAVAISHSTVKAQNPPVNPGEFREPSLVGVWLTQVTRRNCDTGEPIAAQAEFS